MQLWIGVIGIYCNSRNMFQKKFQKDCLQWLGMNGRVSGMVDGEGDRRYEHVI